MNGVAVGRSLSGEMSTQGRKGGQATPTILSRHTSSLCLLSSYACESMEELKSSHHPIINFRPIKPSDLEVLEQLHRDLFPIRYEPEFFHNVVNGNDIVSWGVVDRSRPNYLGDQLIGFVTVKIVLAKESEVLHL
ncbi:Histone acetyltransferase MCC1-like protein, partial [Drosera capensis]